MNQEIELFNKLVASLLRDDKEQPVVKPIPPEQLFQTLDLDLEDDAISGAQFEEILTSLVSKTPKTGNNKFFNQLFGGRQPKAILGDLLAVILNNSMYTYKVAGPQVGVEKAVLRKVAQIIGYPESADGTFPTGGSLSNFMALVMARDRVGREVKEEGVRQDLIAYTSEDSHYSNFKNASFAGIGRNNVRTIRTDDHGRMHAPELRAAILEDLKNGKTPCFINATAGTTVMGAFDPIHELADVAEEFGLWLHVDGAYCGGVIFSDKYKHYVDGLERSDSFSFNAHKMLGTPLTCSVILVKDREDLVHSFSNEADYLYQTADDEFNLGKTSLQCGRRNEALKLWSLWKSVGTSGLAKIVDKLFELAEVARKYVADHPDYTLYTYRDSLSICFNYKGIDPRVLCTGLYTEGELMVGYGSFREDEFVRLVAVNANNSEEDILNFFKTLEKFADTHQLVESKFVNTKG